jgi:two-component system, OmpR family, sensor histidine kinase VanS
MKRRPGLSARLKLTISYAGFLLLTGTLLLALVWVFLLRYGATRHIGPMRDQLAAIIALALLLVFGLLGGWFLAGRMLAPLIRIADAARMAANGSLTHRIRLQGRTDEFRELADVFDTMLDQLESHVTEQQRFAANASHELRTPLAISHTLLDGTLDLTPRPTGGLLVTIRLPSRRGQGVVR